MSDRCSTEYETVAERSNRLAEHVRRQTRNYGLGENPLGPPIGHNRLQMQREAAYRDMMGVAAKLQRDGYGHESDTVIDFIVARRDTGIYPDAYAVWLRDMFPALEVEVAEATEAEVEAVYEVVAMRADSLRDEG
jgi:hypothetical protein